MAAQVGRRPHEHLTHDAANESIPALRDRYLVPIPHREAEPMPRFLNCLCNRRRACVMLHGKLDLAVTFEQLDCRPGRLARLRRRVHAGKVLSRRCWQPLPVDRGESRYLFRDALPDLTEA